MLSYPSIEELREKYILPVYLAIVLTILYIYLPLV